MNDATSAETLVLSWDLARGDRVRRSELHDQYGGNRQGGISPSSRSPNILVFSDAASGYQHGYFDRWDEGTFIYCGEGQEGDQEMLRGNRAIAEHREQGRALRVFQGARGIVTYVGQFELDPLSPWSYEPAPSTSGHQRKVIMFRLRPLDAHTPSPPSDEVGNEYRPEDEDVSTAARAEFRVDPDAVDRGLRGHRRTQNLLAEWISDHGLDPRSPASGEPRFDIAWRAGEKLFVAEVKSLSGGLNKDTQLRLGLGQVLDYTAQFADRGIETIPVLAVEHQPDDRWERVCARYNVILVWPGVLSRLTFPA